MNTRIDEIGPEIFRLSTFIPEVAPPAGFTFNQFLILGDEPFLFHAGMRALFPDVSRAVARVMPLEELRWICFGHFEADECGALNQWLEAAPRAQALHNRVGCDVSLTDYAARPPRALSEGELIDLGGKRIRYIETPHVPHGWDSGLVYEETSGTLFCGDLFTHMGDVPALTDKDLVGPAIEAEEAFQSTSLGPSTGPTIRRLAELNPRRLAVMHGASFDGECRTALDSLADFYEGRLRSAMT